MPYDCSFITQIMRYVKRFIVFGLRRLGLMVPVY